MYRQAIRLLLSTLLVVVMGLSAAGVAWVRLAEEPNLAALLVLGACFLASVGGVWVLWSPPRGQRSVREG